jgi:hypothetical protein
MPCSVSHVRVWQSYMTDPLPVLCPACVHAHAGMPFLGPAAKLEVAPLLQWLENCYAGNRITISCEACWPFFILSLQCQVTLDRVIVLQKSIKQMAFVLQSLCAIQPLLCSVCHDCQTEALLLCTWQAPQQLACHHRWCLSYSSGCLLAPLLLFGGRFSGSSSLALAGCCLLGREAAHVCCSTGHCPAAMPVQAVCLRLCFFIGGALLAAAAALPLPAAAFLAEGLPISAAVVPSSFCTFMSWHTAICTVHQPLGAGLGLK